MKFVTCAFLSVIALGCAEAPRQYQTTCLIPPGILAGFKGPVNVLEGGLLELTTESGKKVMIHSLSCVSVEADAE